MFAIKISIMFELSQVINGKCRNCVAYAIYLRKQHHRYQGFLQCGRYLEGVSSLSQGLASWQLRKFYPSFLYSDDPSKNTLSMHTWPQPWSTGSEKLLLCSKLKIGAADSFNLSWWILL